MNRKQARQLEKELNKKMAGMSRPDKEKLLLATQQMAVAKTMQDLAPDVLLQGMDTAHIVLYETFIQPIVEGADREEQIEKMISFIGNRYLKAKQRQSEMKDFVKANQSE